MWTDKHNAICLKKRLSPSAKLLWQWLVEEGEGEREPDLKDFNTWVQKHRGSPYHRDTLKIAWNQLIDAEVIIPEKKFTWRIWRVVVRSLESLFPKKPRKNVKRKTSKAVENPRDLDSSNACVGESGVQAAAANNISSLDLIGQLPEEEIKDLEENLNQCDRAGIQFDAKDAAEILTSYDPEELRQAIALFEKRGGHQRIKNPEGFIRRCLERGWWEIKRPTFDDVLKELAAIFGLIPESKPRPKAVFKGFSYA